MEGFDDCILHLNRFDERRGGTPLARVSRSRGAERERGERRGGGEKGGEWERGRERETEDGHSHIFYPYRFCHAEFEAAKTRSCDKLGTKSITTKFHFFITGL